MSSIPAEENISIIGPLRASAVSISTKRVSRRPSRRRRRSLSRVESCSEGYSATGVVPFPLVIMSVTFFSTGFGGRRISRSLSSASSEAFDRTLPCSSDLIMPIESSNRSRMMDSTSRPTYPTSVNFDASTLMNGELSSFASLRAISVFPTPVGPIMMMFLGEISSPRSFETFWRRHRLRSAIATARLASFCPMMYWSSF